MTCQTAICPLCLVKHHSGHNCIDVMEERTKTLLQSAQSVKNSINSNKKLIMATKEESEKNNKICEAGLIARKEVLMKRFDQYIQLTRQERMKVSRNFDNEMQVINESVDVLEKIIQNTNPNSVSYGEVTTKLETVNEIQTKLNSLNRTRNLSSLTHVFFKEDQEKCAGKLMRRDRCLRFPEMRVLEYEGESEGPSPKRRRLEAVRSVPKAIKTDYTTIQFLSVIDHVTVAVCGKMKESWKLSVFSLQNSNELRSRELEEEPVGMAVVAQFGDDSTAPWIALSSQVTFGTSNTVFLRSDNFLLVDCTDECFQSSKVHNTASPTTMIYSCPNVVRFLDSTTFCSRNYVNAKEEIVDACYAEDGETELVIIIQHKKQSYYAIIAYNRIFNNREWICYSNPFGMEAESITTDNRGHLFVSDSHNECIQKFSANGNYLGPAVKAGEQGLGKPFRVRWCDKTSTLFVAHVKNGDWLVSVIKV